MAKDAPNHHDDDYPLNCIDDTGDGFSGWFAISNPRQCNDFCYWQLPSQNGSSYAAWNTANPHMSTVVSTPIGTAYWTCAYDSADDTTIAAVAEEHRWDDSWRKYYSPPKEDGKSNLEDVIENVPFPYLKCQKGAGELLKTWSGDVVKSAAFWESWIMLASLIVVGEIVALCIFRKRGKSTRYEQVRLGTDRVLESGGVDFNEMRASSLHIDGEGDADDEINFVPMQWSFLLSLTFNQRATRALRCKYCAPLTSRRSRCILRILLMVILNGLLAATLSFLAVSLIEVEAHPQYSERMQKMTPACSDPVMVCPAGNRDIDKQSAQWPPLEGTDTMQPFSYIIASDAQLYWFNGEFAEMGRKALPPSCRPSDSCGECTGKHGMKTNLRLRKAWESLMTGKTDGMNASHANLPIPNTLVMNGERCLHDFSRWDAANNNNLFSLGQHHISNAIFNPNIGDLTAYFHPWEKRAYDSIYNSIDGLKYYFPSLGNHDIEHSSGAMYGGDQWVGPPNCNMEHAIGYMKSGICGQIPAFDADRIVRYDSSNLAYSWDDGRYHFVHSHYYPSYEMASVKYRSSLEWLERDLQLARDSGLTTILFVHAAQGLNEAMETIILGKNVRAIIAGHTHRCLSRKCEGVYPLHEAEVNKLNPQELADAKCIPAAYDTCQVLYGENMIYVKDKEVDVPFPKRKPENTVRKDKPLCPKPAPFYINDTDNSLLCRRVLYSQPNFPFGSNHSSLGETIPIFWSGSASFETFLRGDFYEDRFVINAMTVTFEGGEVARYVDLHEVPNAVYPYHDVSDIEEAVIYI